MIPLPKWIDIETISSCNRVCPTCLRNSHPNKKEIASWFKTIHLGIDVIEEVLRQAKEIGFDGDIRLSHFNEPTMDERLPDIAQLVKDYGYKAYINTNGDRITQELAKRLDEVFEEIIITLYMAEPVKSKRAEWLSTLFTKAKIVIITQSDHIPSHYSPAFDVKGLADQYRENPCHEPEMRIIINHRRQYLLCCEDVVGNYGFPLFPDVGIADFWYGEQHQEIMRKLQKSGGRHWHSYCESCPKS